jgi:hypothetical protein
MRSERTDHQRATYVYVGLLLITAIAFWLTVGQGSASLNEAESIVWAEVMCLVYLKVRWIMLDFMELRSAPIKLRLLFELFAAALAGGLTSINWCVA